MCFYWKNQKNRIKHYDSNYKIYAKIDFLYYFACWVRINQYNIWCIKDCTKKVRFIIVINHPLATHFLFLCRFCSSMNQYQNFPCNTLRTILYITDVRCSRHDISSVHQAPYITLIMAAREKYFIKDTYIFCTGSWYPSLTILNM